MQKLRSFILVILVCCMVGNYVETDAATLPRNRTSGKCGENVTWTYLDNQYVNEPAIYIQGTGAMYDYEAGMTPWNLYAKDLENIVVCNGVTAIGENAFYGMSGLKMIEITDDVTKIADTALTGCSSKLLIAITSNSYVKTYASQHGYQVIENYAVTIPYEMPTIGSNIEADGINYTVTKCKKGNYEVAVNSIYSAKKNVVIPAVVKIDGLKYKVTEIEDRAFENCNTMRKIVIGKNISRIGEKAFANVGTNGEKDISIKVPTAKQKSYKLILKKKGFRSKW